MIVCFFVRAIISFSTTRCVCIMHIYKQKITVSAWKCIVVQLQFKGNISGRGNF